MRLIAKSTTVEDFVSNLPQRHRGAANFRAWSNGVADTWQTVNDTVWRVICQDETYLATLSDDYRREAESEAGMLFSRGVSMSIEPNIEDDTLVFRSLTIEEWGNLSVRYRQHSIAHRARIWVLLIELRKKGKLEVYHDVTTLENLPALELYCIERILRTKDVFDVQDIEKLLVHGNKIHNEIVANWNAEDVDELYTFELETEERVRINKLTRAHAPHLRSGGTEKQALDLYLKKKKIFKFADSTDTSINLVTTKRCVLNLKTTLLSPDVADEQGFGPHSHKQFLHLDVTRTEVFSYKLDATSHYWE